jgi:hypothetical protein
MLYKTSEEGDLGLEGVLNIITFIRKETGKAS